MQRVLLVLIVVGLVALGLLRSAPDDVRPPPAARETSSGAAAPEEVASGGDSPGADGPGRPRSLRGTRVDGGLGVDAAGHFVATIETRRFFDYFLAATGEVAPEALRARIVAAIERRLAAAEAPAAVALLDRYLDYRARARALAEQPDGGGDLDTRFARVQALRREVFSSTEVEAFFAAEEAEVRREIARRAVAADPALSAEERRARLDAIDADAPPEVREARAASALAGTLQQEEGALRARGGSPAEVQALRERLVGAAAAARLAELDGRRADWRARVERFRAEREGILGDHRRPPAEREAAVEQLANERFTAPERLRLQALDEIDAAAHAAD